MTLVSDFRFPMLAITAGVASSDYGTLVAYHADKGAFHATSNAISVACGRLSYSFGFSGPSISIDTACSASLVALHLAARGLHEGAARLSYASGVHLQCTQTSTSYVWAASMLSASGRCRVLDASADGYVRGETAISFALTSASELSGIQPTEAVALQGSAVNQDGRSSSLTAPNGPAQQEVIRAALAFGGLQPSLVAGLSMHGTGTSLGDPIEVGAAAAVYDGPDRASALALAASKSWVGHAEPAAGLAGMLFAQRMAVHRAALPLMHLREVNPYVGASLKQGSALPALLPKESGGQANGSRMPAFVGVSAFAFQGTNAHAVIQAADNDEKATLLVHAASAWEKRRHYVHAPMNLLATTAAVRVAGGQRCILLQSNVASPQVSFAWDHQVLGKAIFPGKYSFF
jgi:acyl transferase domain-containing protein